MALIDDHILVSAALKCALTMTFPGSEVRTYQHAVAFLERTDDWVPDIIISDVLMPGFQGINLVNTLAKSISGNTKIIILSGHTDISTVKNAIKYGASGFISKSAPIEELMDAIHTIHTGEVYVSKALSKKLIKNLFVEEQINIRLTPREKEVLHEVCKGLRMKEIAYNMNLSINTIHSFQKNILKKFNVSRTTDLIVEAIRAGLFNPDQVS